jgi:LL-diaminopimelate aminotransferase
MAGHTGPANEFGAFEGLMYLPCTPANGFVPEIPTEKADIIYLCYPNNPTGATATRGQLTAWVQYARSHQSIILYDAAYESYISDPSIPHSIFEIPGARDCAIEFRSFSKNAGFTGLRCAFTVVPKALTALARNGERRPLHPLWQRRMSTKFNGVSYPIQRAAEAVYTPAGKAQVAGLVGHYMENARILREACAAIDLEVAGGANAPYIWVRTPIGIGSWDMFDIMLEDANIVVTPGAGFGSNGEGFFRISAFNSRSNAQEAARRIVDMDF